MVPYFPFRDQFDASMGARPYTPTDRMIEIDSDYLHETQLKRVLLARDHSFYYRAAPDTLAAQWETVALVLEDMARFQPQQCMLTKRGDVWEWSNTLLGETTRFRYGDTASLPLEPLDWVGRQVQEDLVILSADEDARLVAGQLCFPNGWSLELKWNQALLHVHKPIPARMDSTMQAAHKLVNRMRPDRPVWRASWNFKLCNDLDMSDRENDRINADFAERAPTLTSDTIGAQTWLRVERQSLFKLPETQHTLFVIHTYQNRLDAEASDPERARRMLGTLETTPRDVMTYKALLPLEAALCDFLAQRSAAT